MNKTNGQKYDEFLADILAQPGISENMRILVTRIKTDEMFNVTFWQLAIILSLRFPDLAQSSKLTVMLALLEKDIENMR